MEEILKTLKCLLIVSLVFTVAAIHSASAIERPFKDGCSGGVSSFYRIILKKPPSFEHCCDAHDRSYTRGGSSNMRMVADQKMKACIARYSVPLSVSMWLAVRAFGQPFHPFDWRYRDDHSSIRWYERSGAE